MILLSDDARNSKSTRRIVWLALLITIGIGLTLVIAPILLIQPFKAQTQRIVDISFLLRRISPLLTIAASILVFFFWYWLWKGSRWYGKAIMVLIAIPLFAATWMARQNHFEWMFRPNKNIAYEHPGSVNFITDKDMVLAVQHNGEAAAYPVRLMAYHHLVQDVVGGTPIVSTY
jgi:uncharacterized BrkB/YihY/UPF0761 family membrane protein